jgi:HlyD family secretion protein
MSIRSGCIAGLALLALLATACAKPQDAAQAGAGGKAGQGKGGKNGPQPVPVLVAAAALRDYAPALVLQGDIRAAQQTTLAAEVAGRIVAIAHRVGEKHGRGAGALLSIDPASYDAALSAAKANLAGAQEELKRLLNGPRAQEIAAQEAAVSAAQARSDQAQDNLGRQQELFDQGAIAETALIDARTAAQTARAALDAAQQALSALRQGSRSEDIAQARAQVDQAQSSVAAAQLQRSRTAIAVPYDAVVTALYAEVGQYVSVGTPLCEVVADKPAEAWFNLPQDKAALVQPGAAVELRAKSLPDAVLQGRVISISPAADVQTRQFPVRVALNDLRLRPGMAVTGRILTAKPALTLMISDDAALESKLGLVVYRVLPAAGGGGGAGQGAAAPAGVETVPVELGEHLNGEVVVLKGALRAGDLLVTRGKEQLYTGAKISPTNIAPPAGAKAAGAANTDRAAAAGAVK